MVLSGSRYRTVAPLGAVVGVSLSPFGIWVILKLLGFSRWFGCGFAEICPKLEFVPQLSLKGSDLRCSIVR